MNNNLPQGCQVRPVTMQDLEPIVELLNIEHRWLNGTDGFELEGIRTDWESGILNLDTDTQALFNPDGQPIGYAEFWDMRSSHTHLFAYVNVHPEYLGRGLGCLLEEWLEQRARANIAHAPERTRVVLHQHVESHHPTACAFLENAGYQNIRSSYRMQIDFNQEPAAPEVPTGITIRSIQDEEEERRAIFAAQESFLDHWGSIDESPEEYYKRRKYFIDNDPHYDPSLFFIALDGAEIAGVSLCQPQIDEDADMAWVSTLGVRRAWRKQGLGLALLRHSFQEFYRRGKPRAGLGVDASSLTGATRLYERAGMRVVRQYYTFEKELRPGKDLSRQVLDN